MSINKTIFNSKSSSVLLVLAFLIVLNILISQKPFYIDLTEEKIYTISNASKDILRGLESDVNVTFYISDDLPVDLIGTKTQLEDLMNQYKDISGKLKVSYNMPENNDETVAELGQKGIPQIQFNVIEKDKYEVRQGFFAAEITSDFEGETKREVMPIIQSIDSWEYDFISAVYSVSRDQKEVVAFLKGHEENEIQIPDLLKSYDILNVQIQSEGGEKGFYFEKEKEQAQPAVEGEEATPAETEKIFIHPITLIISGPKTKLTEGENAIIEEYMKSGGNVIVLSEAIAPDMQKNLEPVVVENGLNNLIKKRGIEIDSNLVYDKSNSNITYQQGFFSVSKAYPFWIKIVKENFGSHPSLSAVQSIMLPWASSLSTNDDSYEIIPILKTTNYAQTMSENYALLPDVNHYFSAGAQKTVAAISRSKEENSSEGILVVVGDSDFASVNFARQSPDNVSFFLNLVDSISNSANLSSIRSKNIVDRPLKELDESEKNYWKFIAIFGGAIAVNLYGVFRITRRKKRSR